jgi:hypothetical protein
VISSSQRPLPDNTNIHDRPTSIPAVGFEPTISAGERPYTYALDRAATGTDETEIKEIKYYYFGSPRNKMERNSVMGMGDFTVLNGRIM